MQEFGDGFIDHRYPDGGHTSMVDGAVGQQARRHVTASNGLDQPAGWVDGAGGDRVGWPDNGHLGNIQSRRYMH